MPKDRDGRTRRDQSNKADSAPDMRRAGSTQEDTAEQLLELSEKGGISPIERRPSEYNDRTRDRTLDEQE